MSREALEPPLAIGEAPLFTGEFAALLLVNVAFSFALSTFYLLPKFMAQQLAAGASEIGAVTTAFGITIILAIPLVGRLLDGSRNQAVMLAGCALMTLSAVGFMGVDRLGPTVLLLRCLQGLAQSLFHNAGSVIVADLAPPSRLAQAIGMFTGTGMVMTAVAPALAETVAEESGYGPVFASAAAAAGVALLLALRLGKRAVKMTQQSSMRSVLLRASSLRMIAVLGTVGLAFGGMFAFSTPFALELGIANVRGFFVAFALGAVIVRFGLGGVIDRLGYRRLTVLSLTGYGLSVIAMVLLAPGRLVWLGGLFGLAHGLFFPSFTAFMVSGGALHERGRLMTLLNGAFNLGNCAVFSLGVAAERFGYRPVFALSGTLVLLTPLLLPRARGISRDLGRAEQAVDMPRTP